MQKDSSVIHDYSQNYTRQWLLFFAIVGSLVAFYLYKTRVYRMRPVPPPPTATPSGTWFYVLRMPEMQIQSDTRSSRQQFSKWMIALQKEGFHFMLLSDVVRQLSQGTTLPEKTAVLVFDPGYRRTADTYIPLLKKMQIPAVWLTDGKALSQDDKRYISQHLSQTMEASGLWDIGFYQPDAPVTLKAHGHETVLLGHRSPWKEDAGRYALNLGYSGNAFDRLNVSSKWTEEDLVHRVLVERPLHASALLSLQEIQGRTCGIGLDADSTKDTRFTLRAATDKRSNSVYWLGTLGANDVHLRIEVKSLVGEMRILMRSDLATGNGLSILFGHGRVAVDQDTNFETERLANVPCPDIAPYIPFNATLAVMGRQLALAVNNQPLIALTTLAEPVAHQGMIRLVVQDSLKGVGEARSVRMIYTPIGKDK